MKWDLISVFIDPHMVWPFITSHTGNCCFGVRCSNYTSSSRYDGDGSTHDVHHCVSDDREHRAQGLEATDVGLWLVFCVSLFQFNPFNPSYVRLG